MAATLLLCGCSQSTVGSRELADRKAIVEAALAYKLLEWQESQTPPPCVRPQLVPLRDDKGTPPPTSRVEKSWLPQPFSLCDQETRSYFSLTEPRVAGDSAYIEIDFHCGDSCLAGAGYSLARVGSGWRVARRYQTTLVLAPPVVRKFLSQPSFADTA